MLDILSYGVRHFTVSSCALGHLFFALCFVFCMFVSIHNDVVHVKLFDLLWGHGTRNTEHGTRAMVGAIVLRENGNFWAMGGRHSGGRVMEPPRNRRNGTPIAQGMYHFERLNTS